MAFTILKIMKPKCIYLPFFWRCRLPVLRDYIELCIGLQNLSVMFQLYSLWHVNGYCDLCYTEMQSLNSTFERVEVSVTCLVIAREFLINIRTFSRMQKKRLNYWLLLNGTWKVRSQSIVSKDSDIPTISFGIWHVLQIYSFGTTLFLEVQFIQ